MIKLKDIICENYLNTDVFYLNETILYSFDSDRVVDVLRQFFEYSDIKIIKDIKKQNNSEIRITLFLNNTSANLKKLIQYIHNLLNWYIGRVLCVKKNEIKFNIDKYDEKDLLKNYSEKDYNILTIILYPHYDLELSELPKTLYHITDEKFIEKIKKIGLIPKSTSKIETHPDRIYFLKSKSDISKILSNPNFKIEHPYLLTIDNSKIKNLKLFEDSNFKTFGLYGYQNIPPKYITVIEKIS